MKDYNRVVLFFLLDRSQTKNLMIGGQDPSPGQKSRLN